MPNVKLTDYMPFINDGGNSTDNPGWLDVDSAFPAVVGSPAADQAEVRIQSTVPAGTYMFGVSVTWTVNSLTNAMQLRFSLDGGTTWEIFSRAASDSGDSQAAAYTFPKVQGAGTIDFVMQMRKETSQNQMSILFASIWYHRVE